MNFVFRFLLLVAASSLGNAVSVPCKLRDTKFGKVCVCTADYCDFLDTPKAQKENEFVVVSSSKEGLRFAKSEGVFQMKNPVEIKDYPNEKGRLDFQFSGFFNPVALIFGEGHTFLQLEVDLKNSKPIKVNVSRETTYQKIVGFGGAFTGSVSYLLNKLDQRLQDQIYKSYYHKTGIGYNMARISIGGSDFDLEPWTYNEHPLNDILLRNFTELDPRDELKVEQLHRLKFVANLDNLKIKGAAWSSPRWMKSNKEWTGYSYLLPEFYQTWANYHLKFLELMAAKNMPLWAISTGNEPLNGVIGWLFVRFMSLGWTADQQAIWLVDHLGPTLRDSKFKDVLIFCNDDQRYTFPSWFKKMNRSRNETKDYIDGLAVHWYWDKVFDPMLIDYTLRDMPGKILLSTESCVGDKPWQTHGPELGSWERGEQYIQAFLQDLHHSFNGWIDWNLILNEQGGPNYVKNYVDSPIIVNETSTSEFYKQPMFYGIGHFSKFIPEGSIRVNVTLSNDKIEAVAFKQPDNSITLILFNGGSAPVDVLLNDSVRGPVMISLPARSIHTVLYN